MPVQLRHKTALGKRVPRKQFKCLNMEFVLRLMYGVPEIAQAMQVHYTVPPVTTQCHQAATQLRGSDCCMQHLGSKPRHAGPHDTDINDSDVWNEKVLQQGFDPKLDVFFSGLCDWCVWCANCYCMRRLC